MRHFASIFFLFCAIQGYGQLKPAENEMPATSQNFSELRCRGGREPLSFQTSPAQTRVTFRKSARAAGRFGEQLEPGTCAFVDRPLRADEEATILLEVGANAVSGEGVGIQPSTMTFADAASINRYLADPNHYWSFLVAKTPEGKFMG